MTEVVPIIKLLFGVFITIIEILTKTPISIRFLMYLLLYRIVYSLPMIEKLYIYKLLKISVVGDYPLKKMAFAVLFRFSKTLINAVLSTVVDFLLKKVIRVQIGNFLYLGNFA